ncbi:MAG TPA: replicative DNA helicase [Bacteroidales bacterium]|nr:replicative DNA helicase [Bacteroidales bacterium]
MDEIKNKVVEKTRRSLLKPIPAALNLADHGRLQPQATELEEAILGAIMLEKDALASVIDKLKPEIFYKDSHQLIFAAILYLFSKAEPVDILTVTAELKKRGELEVVGGAYYVTQLTNKVASSANVEYHTHIILQKFIQRELIRLSSEIINESFEDRSDVFDVLDKAERNLFSLSDTNTRRNVQEMGSLLKEAITNIGKARSKDGGLSGVPSGFTELDGITGGWQPSDLIIIAARPGMGKTALVLSMARRAAVDLERSIAFFSLEMSAIQLVTRLISSETQIPADTLRKGALKDHEWHLLNAKIKKLEDAKLFIDDTPALTIFELRAKCRRLKAQHNIDMVIIDYLQLMSGGGESRGNREQEISNISRSLKSLAKELNIPIIAISQLSRAVEVRGGSKKPILSDLRESGAIEQDADLVLFIYRPEYYGIDKNERQENIKGMAQLSIAKHRNGALKDIWLRFFDRFAMFTDDLAQAPYGGASEPGQTSAVGTVTRQSKFNEETGEDDKDSPPF